MSTAFSLLMFFIYVVLPVFLIIRIWNNSTEDWFQWIVSTLSNAAYILCLFVIGGWPVIITGFYMRYIFLVALCIAVIKSYFNKKKYFVKVRPRRFITLVFSTLGGLLPLGIIATVLLSSNHIPEAIHMAFPLKSGNYYILQGGNSSIINHHLAVDAQKYAVDIIKLNRFGGRLKSFNYQSLEDYSIYGDVIYSPCDGVIVEMADNYPDLQPGLSDPEHPAGNYLAIESPSSHTTTLLAHIQKGSFMVQQGDTVTTGQPLCRVGNSGNTSEPHLHIHVIKSGGDLLYDGEGIPMKFDNRFLIRNDLVSSFSIQ